MPIEFRCSNCNKLLRVGDNAAGKRAKCPQCATVLTIPTAAPAPEPEPAASGNPLDELFGPSPTGPAPAASAPPPSPFGGVNPYQAPQAPPGMPAGRVSLDLGEVLSRTWAIFKLEPATCILAQLVAGVLMGLAVFGSLIIAVLLGGVLRSEVVTFLLMILAIAVSVVAIVSIQMGLLRIFLKIAKGERTGLGELFKSDPRLLPFIGASILVNLIVNLGTMACIVPGIILGLMFSQVQFLILDRNVAAMDSLGASKKLTDGHKMQIFVVLLVTGLAAGAVTVLTLGIGGLVAGPFVVLETAVVYLTLTGQRMAA